MPERKEYQKRSSPKIKGWSLRLAIALSAGAGLIYEIASTQALTYFFGSSIYPITIVMVAFLLGMAFGSIITAQNLERLRHKANIFVVLQLITGLYSLIVLVQYARLSSLIGLLYQVTGSNPLIILLAKFIISVVLLMIPTSCLGASFPLIISIAKGDHKGRKDPAGKSVGILYSLDLFGAVLGSLLVGIVVVPIFGLKAAFLFGAALNMISSLFVLIFHIKPLNHIMKAIITAVILAVFSMLTFSAVSNQIRFSVDSPNQIETLPDKDVLFERMTPYGEVLVTSTYMDVDEPTLFIDHIRQCNTKYSPLQKNLGESLKFLKPGSQVLDVGLGCGYSSAMILEQENVLHLDIVEINSALLDSLHIFSNEHLLTDQRADIIIDDIMHYTQSSKNTYDLINLELNIPSLGTISPFYTVEYLSLLGKRLSEQGIIRLWISGGNYEYVKAFYKTVKEVYPNVVIKTDGRQDYYFNTELIISKDPEASIVLQTKEEQELQSRIENDTDYEISTLDRQVIGEIWYAWSQENFPSYFNYTLR